MKTKEIIKEIEKEGIENYINNFVLNDEEKQENDLLQHIEALQEIRRKQGNNLYLIWGIIGLYAKIGDEIGRNKMLEMEKDIL